MYMNYLNYSLCFFNSYELDTFFYKTPHQTLNSKMKVILKLSFLSFDLKSLCSLCSNGILKDEGLIKLLQRFCKSLVVHLNFFVSWICIYNVTFDVFLYLNTSVRR